MVLGPLMEENLRRAPLVSRGEKERLCRRPLSAVLIAAAGLPVLAALPTLPRKRDEVLAEGWRLRGETARSRHVSKARTPVPPLSFGAGSSFFRV
jgi:hypothetical protein